ncbi:unnamed protein product [Candidula unifasciata]|uniref:Scavenger receptor class B member 1 n=1 Tax=Candidula unifasciata TaxID=100452 RepID=A0A8S3YMU8_9EUPU|nr:unnamed protein product [Candidula unifasciata]
MLGLTRRQVATLSVLGISGLAFLICGIVFNDMVDVIMQEEIKKQLPLKNGTIGFKNWQKPPVPVKFGIYVFDIVNPAEVLAGEPPAVLEKGPYVYSMHIEKTDIKWHDNNTVEYVQPQRFVFNREESVGPDTDTFRTVNILYIATATILQGMPPLVQDLVDAYLVSQGEDTFMIRSVHDIWWGYEDPVLEEVAKILERFNKSSPLFNGKFGFFMNRNNTGDGLYNVYSGLNGQFDNYVRIDRWNGKKNLSVWYSEYANEIRGTDGSMHPPFVNKDSTLSVFDAYLLRSLKLQYSTDSSFKNVRTLRFLVPYSEFASAKENPDNAGFCTPNCIPSGAYNMSVITYDAPVYVSLPHFIGGDSYYQSLVKGLTPTQSLHQPFYDIQPLTGVSMTAARRYQINLRTQSFDHFLKFQNFPVSYLPVLWIDGVAEIDEDTAVMFKGMIQDRLDTLPYIHGAMFAIGGLFLLISMGLFIYWKKKNVKFTAGEHNEEEINILHILRVSHFVNKALICF